MYIYTLYVYIYICIYMYICIYIYNWFWKDMNLSPPWSRHFQTFSGFCLSWAARQQDCGESRKTYRYLTLFDETENSAVICRASFHYKLGYPFGSTLIVSMNFHDGFRSIRMLCLDRRAAFLTSLVNDDINSNVQGFARAAITCQQQTYQNQFSLSLLE